MNTPSAIDSILSAPQFASLRKEIVEFDGRQVLLVEQCGLTDARRGRIDAEIKLDKTGSEFIDPSEKIGLSRLYIDLASVSFGNVPTFLEFAAMRTAESSIWLDVAIEVNPVLFDWLKQIANAVEEIENLAEVEAKKK